MKIIILALITSSYFYLHFPFTQPNQLTEKTTIIFADSAMAAGIVATEDDYTERVSSYTRSASLRSGSEVSQKQYLDHLSRNVMNWDSDEIKRFQGFVAKIKKQITAYNLNLPEEIVLIKTTSDEVGGASPAYTRQNAIMFTAPMVIHSPDSILSRVLIHEIAHVYSRFNREKRPALYNVFGFKQVNEIILPQAWQARIITNPDAPEQNTMITVTKDDQQLYLSPFLHAGQTKYNTEKKGGIFQSVSFKLMQIENVDGKWQAVLKDDSPVLFAPNQLEDFWKQIGKNTNYIIHPEEIMASNFELMILEKTGLPNPEKITDLKKIVAP